MATVHYAVMWIGVVAQIPSYPRLNMCRVAECKDADISKVSGEDYSEVLVSRSFHSKDLKRDHPG